MKVDSPRRPGRREAASDEGLLQRISKAVESVGLHRLSLAKVHRLLTVDQSGNVPSTTTLSKILREHFLLRFRATNAAHIKYNDTEYDLKRVWVSRLLT